MAGVSWTYNVDDQETRAAVISAASDSTIPLDVRRHLYHTITAYASGISATKMDLFAGNNTSTGLVQVLSATVAEGANVYTVATSGGAVVLNGGGIPAVFNWLYLKKRGGGVVWFGSSGK